MNDEPPVPSSQRNYLRAKLVILSENCLLNSANPPACPFHEFGDRGQKERMAWFDGLSDEAVLNIYTFCQLRCEKYRGI